MKPAVCSQLGALLAVALACVACGGPSSAGDEPQPALAPQTSVAPVSPAVADPSFCDVLCGRMLGCMAEIAGTEPTDDERRAFGERCPQRCESQPPASLDAAQACLEERGDSCPELVSCLKPID